MKFEGIAQKTDHVWIEDGKWGMIDLAVEAFKRAYPAEMRKFVRQNKGMRTKFQESWDPVMRNIAWRNTLSFPIARNPLNEDDDCLLPILKRIMPELLKDDRTYREFCRRHPEFLVPEHV